MQTPDLKNRLAAWRQSDPAQAKNLGAVVRLFAVMLVLTLVARGTAGASMPKVTTASPYSGSVTTQYTATGAIAARDGEPFKVPSGLLVRQVCADVGQSVAAGDTLAVFDTDTLALALGTAEAELAQLRTTYEQQNKGDAADDFALQQAQEQLQRAYDAAQKTWDEGEQGVADARDARDSAEAALNALLAEAPATAESAEAADRQAEVEAARQNLAAAEDALAAARQAADAANEAAANAAQGYEDARDSAAHSYRESAEDIADANAANRAAAGVTLAQINAKKAEVAAMQRLLAAGGAYAAPVGGTVTRMDLAAGETSTAVGGLIADAESGSTLTFLLDRKAAALATVGQSVHLTQNAAKADAPIAALSVPAEDGSVTATVRLEAGGWKAGAAAVALTLNAGQYDLCLPSTAVNEDSGGYFVYTIEERSTVLGLQNVLVRNAVTVEASGDGVTAVSGAGLSGGIEVVSGADKPLRAGARVRYAE